MPRMPAHETDPDSLRQRLDHLEDLEALRTLKALYARHADAVFRTPGPAAAEAIAALFTEDGVLDLGPFGRYAGRDAIRAASVDVLPVRTGWSTHYVHSPILEVRGDEATGSWYFLIYAQPKAAPGVRAVPPSPIFGSYADRYSRMAEGWRFVESVASYAQPAT
jgi:hypothetical protein